MATTPPYQVDVSSTIVQDFLLVKNVIVKNGDQTLAVYLHQDGSVGVFFSLNHE